MTYGPRMMKVLKFLVKMRGLRGTPLDLFGYSAERKTERRLIAEYNSLMTDIIGALTPDNYQYAVALAEIPEFIRGFGPIKAKSIAVAKTEQDMLLDQFKNPDAYITPEEDDEPGGNNSDNAEDNGDEEEAA